jgi:CBS domain containing-hemolysin-like protein
VNPVRLKSRGKDGEGFALKTALRIREDYENVLSTILVGNNIVNMASSTVATLIVISWWGDDYAWASTVIMTILVLTFGEIMPKVIAKQIPESFCVMAAVPIYVLSLVLKPLTVIVMAIVSLVSKLWEKSVTDSEAVSEDDFENIIDIVEEEGILDEEDCDLLQNALDFDDVLAYEIITHRVDMECIDIRDPYEVNVRKCEEFIYSRIPVYEDTTDNIIGILHLNHFYKAYVSGKKVNFRDLLLPVNFVHKTMPLPDVLEKMKENKCHMVVVLDEYGGTMGILTMEDVLEQLVGEIFDESDEIEREFVCIDDTHFEADGDMRVYDFFDEFDIDIDENEDFEGDTATVGGWTLTMLEGEVNEGDNFTFENLEITVLKVDGYRIERIGVHELPIQEEE